MDIYEYIIDIYTGGQIDTCVYVCMCVYIVLSVCIHTHTYI